MIIQMNGNCRRAICFTGLLRHFDEKEIINFTKITKSLGASRAYLSFWDYDQNTDIPSSNNLNADSVIPTIFKEKLMGNRLFVTQLIKPPERIEVDALTHNLDSILRLKPNVNATKSWFSALREGSSFLSREIRDEKQWLIFRPDLHIARLNLIQLKIFLDRFELGANEILAAKRHIPHKVLLIGEAKSNLPMDHFFFGESSSKGIFLQLIDYFDSVIGYRDTRQPLVNEFLLGQYLNDKEIKILELPLPYVLRRGSLLSSITPNSTSMPRKYLGIFRHVLFLIKQSVLLQILVISPKSIYKFQI